MRMLVSLPVAVVALVVVGSGAVTHDPVHVAALRRVSIVGAWLITLLVNLAVGCFGFFLESSLKLMDTWLVFYFVLSGYLIPVDLFPPALRAVVDWLPFRYQIGFPVELMTGRPRHGARALAPRAAVDVGARSASARRRGSGARGLRRFAAYGG